MIALSASTESRHSREMRAKIFSRKRHVLDQARIARGDGEARFRQHHVHVGKLGAEERPADVHRPQRLEPVLGVGVDIGLHRRAEAEPAGQHQSALRPREHPGNRAQILDRLRFLARGGARADVEAGDLGDDGRGPEIAHEPIRLVDEAAIGLVSASPTIPPSSREKRDRARGSRPASSVASSVAEASVSRLRRPTSGLEYLLEMISPCSVMRICPCTAPPGWARIAS